MSVRLNAPAVDPRKQFDLLYGQYKQAFARRDFDQALEAARRARKLSNSPEVVHSEALCLHRLGRSEEAYTLVNARPGGSGNEGHCDLMADICGALGKADEVRAYGSAALAIRDRKFANGKKYPIPQGAPRPASSGKQIVAFSLFGSSPRYCEVAIMNCEAVARLLLEWRCRFYCDESVPEDVRDRIAAAGGEVAMIGARDRNIHPLMWRFLAADDPEVSRFLMRDADSLVGEREAAAVGAWLASGKWFHLMRDYYTHTELILAGMWGGCTAVIPDMRKEMLDFLSRGDFEPSHLDQYFLRTCLWPTVRQSVLSHDSQFDFFNNEPFPHVEGASLYPRHHVGANLSTSAIGSRIEAADGATRTLSILDREGRRICAYEVRVQGQRWQISVPDSYADRIETGEWVVRITEGREGVS